jgi:tetratricopeptide (TPR) repeat protein
MATVSVKNPVTVTVLLWTSVYILGCSSMMPLEHRADEARNDDRVEQSRQQVMAPAGEAPLPRQTYNSAGKKVPYVPLPNPYTTKAATIPAEAKAIFAAGSRQLQGGDLKGARAKFRRLTEKYPSLSGPWVKLGVIAEKREKYDEAIKCYKQAISVNKNNVNAYIALGLVQRRQGHFSDAQKSYLQALGVWRDFPEAHLNLAILYDLYANKPEEAQKHYEAYYFLTGMKNEKVHKWLVEVKRRTGIERSFIDVPPGNIAEVPVERAAVARAAVGN